MCSSGSHHDHQVRLHSTQNWVNELESYVVGNIKVRFKRLSNLYLFIKFNNIVVLYDSFQSLGNVFRSSFAKHLKTLQPELFILTTRHPIERLISGWNNILCLKNCRDESRIKFGSLSLFVADNFRNLKPKLHKVLL